MTKAQSCPKYLPADNPARAERDSTIIAMAATGKPYSQIAAVSGIVKSRVCQILSDDDAKAKLQAIIHKHIQATDIIQDVLISKAIDPENTDNMKAISEHNKIIGISGSHTQNVHIEKLYQQNNSLSLSAGVLKMLSDNRHDAPIDIPGYDDDSA